MGTQHKTVRIILWVLLIICMLILTKYILFKKSSHYYKNFFTGQNNSQVIKNGWKNANLKPFSTIRLFYRVGVRSVNTYKNIGGNIIGFVPLGILLPLLFMRLRRWWKTAIVVFIISLSFEIAQLVTGWGMFDVDDLILNTAGGWMGFILFFLGAKIFFEITSPPG